MWENMIPIIIAIIAIPLSAISRRRTNRTRADLVRNTALNCGGKFEWTIFGNPRFTVSYNNVVIELSCVLPSRNSVASGKAVIKFGRTRLPTILIGLKANKIMGFLSTDIGLAFKRDISTGRADFDDIYFIRSNDENIILNFITSDVMDVLIANVRRKPSIGVSRNSISITISPPENEEGYGWLLETSKKLCDKIMGLGYTPQ